MSDFKKGDHVQFTIHSRPNYGVVQEKVTEDKPMGRITVHASEKNPQYIIKHDRTGTEFNRHANKMEKLESPQKGQRKSKSKGKEKTQDQGEGEA